MRSRRPETRRSRSSDAGFGLTEMLVSVVVTGLLMGSLSMMLVAVFRHQDNSGGRLNNANAEQTVSLMLPADLTSAETVDTSPGASPCAALCPAGLVLGGSNALLASWTEVVSAGPPVQTRTNRVSWRYRQIAGRWQVARIACVESTPTWTCSERVVLVDAPPPPSGVQFTAGTTSPTWALKVVNPLAADDASFDPTGAVAGVDPATAKGARRVIVTVDGGGDGPDAGGGMKAISLTAGSTARTTSLDPGSMPAPSLGSLVSRCGGNFGLLVDMSGSIGANMADVRQGLTTLKEVFQGTPVKLQLVGFEAIAVWHDGTKWQSDAPHWFDMLEPTDVAGLQQGIDGMISNGSTNYEHGFYRSFRNNDATGTEQAIVPTTLLFFTDGQVNSSRRTANNDKATSWVPPIDPNYAGFWGAFNSTDQFNRALYWANLYRSRTRMIGVGVGTVTANAAFSQTLARLVAGNDTGVPAVLNSEQTAYTNADTANMFVTPDWNLFSTALESVALGMCGGTVTVRTVANGTALGVPVSYLNTSVTGSDGAEVAVNTQVVVTTPQYPGGTFDFKIPKGDYVDVTIAPSNLAELAQYQPVSWTCTVRGVSRPVTTVPIADSSWSGVVVRVQANDPVSCQLAVQPL